MPWTILQAYLCEAPFIDGCHMPSQGSYSKLVWWNFSDLYLLYFETVPFGPGISKPQLWTLGPWWRSFSSSTSWPIVSSCWRLSEQQDFSQQKRIETNLPGRVSWTRFINGLSPTPSRVHLMNGSYSNSIRSWRITPSGSRTTSRPLQHDSSRNSSPWRQTGFISANFLSLPIFSMHWKLPWFRYFCPIVGNS